MASSVAARPQEPAPWRDPPPSSARPRAGLFNILIPPPQQHHASAAGGFSDNGAPSSAPSERTPRRMIVRERWAAAAAAAQPAPRVRDADAELSALASAARPVVAARAAVFREPSPAPSDASSTATAAGQDLPPSGPRASSLIQRWREMEAVGPATPRTCADLASDSDGSASPPGRFACVRGRRAMEELVARMAHRRTRELHALEDRHAVSHFAQKGRIQSMLRLRLLRQGDSVHDEVKTLLRPVRPHLPKRDTEASTVRNTAREADLQEAKKCSQENNRHDVLHKDDPIPPEEKSIDLSVENLVMSGSSGDQQYDEHLTSKRKQCQKDSENLVNLCVQNQECSEASSSARYDDHSTVSDNQYVDDISPSTTSTFRELQDTPSSRCDDLQEEDNRSMSGSWDDRALWINSLGWPDMSPDSWHQDAIPDLENHNQIEFSDRHWVESPNSWRSLHNSTQADCRALSGNADICNLLESKNVSKSLESDFSKKMNRLLLAMLHKQRQNHIIDDFGGYYQERLYWRQNDEPQREDQVAAASYPLAPSSHLAARRQERWQHPSFEHQHRENQNLLEMEARVRSEMAQIRHELYELRKLAESCIASQVKMQHSIKEELCSALREAGLMPSPPDTTVKGGSCCICHQMQVNSLLYRCGHMCTCFNCADQLKSSSKNCPICQSPIEDVVRAQLNF